MSVSITDCNFRKFLDTADKILQCTIIPIRLVARLVGIMVSFFPGVEYARRFYRQLGIEKSIALKTAGWNFGSDMTLSETAKDDILWWIHHAQTSKRKLIMGKLHGNLEPMPLPMGGVLSQRESLLVADGHLKKLSYILMPWNF